MFTLASPATNASPATARAWTVGAVLWGLATFLVGYLLVLNWYWPMVTHQDLIGPDPMPADVPFEDVPVDRLVEDGGWSLPILATLVAVGWATVTIAWLGLSVIRAVRPAADRGVRAQLGVAGALTAVVVLLLAWLAHEDDGTAVMFEGSAFDTAYRVCMWGLVLAGAAAIAISGSPLRKR